MERIGKMIIKKIMSVKMKNNFHWTTNLKKIETCSILTQFRATYLVSINKFMSKSRKPPYSCLLLPGVHQDG